MFSSVVFRLSKMKLFTVFLSFLICLLIDVSHQEMCTNSSGLNEVFSKCEGDGYCQKTCLTRNKVTEKCNCKPGFICKKGYIRCPNTYRCILEKYCGTIGTCPSNEVYSDCFFNCEKMCSSLDSEVECKPCRAGCICAVGYARCDVTNRCIKKEKCSGNIISLFIMFDEYN